MQAKESMRIIPAILLFIAVSSLQTYAQNRTRTFIVVSYNVENLFDTVNTPEFEDDEFTPAGMKKWTYDRYEKKLDDLSRVILSLPEKELPALIGLVEVENKEVLQDLIQTRGLRKGDYRIVHEDGGDPRGIECALLYRPEYFHYKSHEYIPVEDPVDPDYKYRGILHVTGTGPDGTRLHIFVNHWKSRSGGEKETERQRMFCAISLRRKLDLIISRESDYSVILMGDFNDEPTNRTVYNGLAAGNKRKNMSLGEYYNLHYDLHNQYNEGTYFYRGRWNMLDQIIISYNLINRDKGLTTDFGGGKILKEEWMLYENEQYHTGAPDATFGGDRYYGGPSDHLPVYVIFTW